MAPCVQCNGHFVGLGHPDNIPYNMLSNVHIYNGFPAPNVLTRSATQLLLTRHAPGPTFRAAAFCASSLPPRLAALRLG